MRIQSYLMAYLLGSLTFVGIPGRAIAKIDESKIPHAILLLQDHCVRCHNDEDRAGELSFSHGPNDHGGWSVDDLLEMVTPVDGQAEMPKEAPALSTQDIAILKAWAEDGAKWPYELTLKPPRHLDLNWWSLRKLPSTAVSSEALQSARQSQTPSDLQKSPSPIDAFVGAKLADEQLACSTIASRRTLIRRAYFDLIGLPPTPEEIERFVADEDEHAWEKLIDQLLQSPRYGERWARHWLDVVHFADTHGYDKDKPRPNAWPYRDYVIRSLNQDKPWSQFIEEQVAGDVLYPGDPDGIEALGLIAAGPWDFVGHAEVPESKIDGQIARHLDRDDMVRTVLQSFTSLTVGCAQCHDHKFDPITQVEYYQLQSVFAALDRADKSYYQDRELNQRYAKLLSSQHELEQELAAISDDLQRRGGERLKELNELIAKIRKGQQDRNTRPEFGYHSALEDQPDVAKLIQIDLGQAVAVDKVVIHPAFDLFNNIGADFGLPQRLRVELLGDGQPSRVVHTVELNIVEDEQRSPGQPLIVNGNGASAKSVRIVADKLAQRLPQDYCLALAEVQVYSKDNESNLASGCVVTATDSIEAPVRWRRSNLVDDIVPLSPIDEGELHKTIAAKERLSQVLLGHDQWAKLQQLQAQSQQLKQELDLLPKPSVVYAGTIHYGTGSFTGTGSTGGRPREVRVLHRGEVTSPKQAVSPGALALVEGLSPNLDVTPSQPEGDRRVALAHWLSSPDNSYTWRSVVNRVWQIHFGTGLVDTANDFGQMGGQPSHPELLDWLAIHFRDQGQSLKSLHRLMMTSRCYMQSSTGTHDDSMIATCQDKDANNRWLWRGNRKRLDVECVRDAILQLSGKLSLEMGGPGFEEFLIEKPEHSPHYRYELHDFSNPATHRRSVYRFVVRSQLQPFMNAMDCADPSIQVARRNESQTPLQALAMLNDGLVLTHSQYYAERLEQKYPNLLSNAVARAFFEVTGRTPTQLEAADLTTYAQEYGLANYCRLLFNLNEFLYVD